MTCSGSSHTCILISWKCSKWVFGFSDTLVQKSDCHGCLYGLQQPWISVTWGRCSRIFKDKIASGVYQSYFWDIHTTCHTWLVLVVIAWAWVSRVLPEWNSLFVNNRHCARGNQSCFCLLVMSSSRVRHSCSWLSLHTSVIQALFGKNLWNLLQRDKEYTVLLSWLSQTLTSWFLFSPWTLFTRQLIFWS